MNKPLSFLREEIDCNNFESIIQEAKEGMPKNYYIQGPMIVAETENKNGRKYKQETIIKEMRRLAPMLKEGAGIAGELGHPSTPDINLDRISHYIQEMKQDGNIWIGKAKIASTPVGNIAKSLMDDGFKLGVSTRGLGTVNEGWVGDNFKLITVDIVSEPSGPGCFVESIMENKQWIIDESTGKIQEVAKGFEELEEKVAELPKREREEYLYRAINDFMEAIKGN